MAERPILFSGPMVRAILAGKKAQTRRIVREQALISDVAGGGIEPAVWWPRRGDNLIPCPYGAPGDELWVRETAWYDRKPLTSIGNLERCFFSDGWVRFESGQNGEIPGSVEDNSVRLDGNNTLRKRPSIFMPRWASRIQLVIRDVRVQRLQEISEEDAIAEGARHRFAGRNQYGQEREGWSFEDPHPIDADQQHGYGRCLGSARFAFGNGWNCLNAKRAPWSSNPWVWAITFERKV